MGLDERLKRLERDAGEHSMTQPIPRELVRALDVMADLKRESFWDDSTPIEELERMMIARGVEVPVAREVGKMCRELREERIARWD